jgi:hypothetical protein
VYQWNNKENGVDVLIHVHDMCSSSSPSVNDHIKANRDYYDNVVKPDYVPYIYPHPLTRDVSLPLPPDAVLRIYIFPNPYHPESGGAYGSSQGITFANLPPKAVIKIFSIFGELVLKHEKDNSDSQYVWKTVNSSGTQVASGVYFYLVTNPDNPAEKATGKLVIVR